MRNRIFVGNKEDKKPLSVEWGGIVVEVDRLLMGKPEGKRPLGRTRRRWEDNIRMDLQEVGW